MSNKVIIPNFPHIRQTDGISCGSTAITMVARFVEQTTDKKIGLDFKSYFTMAGTNPKTGTVPDGITRAFNGAGIGYEFKSKDTVESLDGLKTEIKDSINSGQPVLVRSLLCNVPHWTIVIGYDDTHVHLADPAGAESKVEWRDYLQRSEKRGFDRYIINPKSTPYAVEMRLLDKHEEHYKKHFSDACRLLSSEFGKHGGSYSSFENMVKHYQSTSPVIIVDGHLVGAYVFIPNGSANELKRLGYDPGKCIEGYAVAVAKAYRDCGYGRLLRDFPRDLGYDTIVGKQLKALNNIEDWLKSRELITETPSMYVTARSLKFDRIPRCEIEPDVLSLRQHDWHSGRHRAQHDTVRARGSDLVDIRFDPETGIFKIM